MTAMAFTRLLNLSTLRPAKMTIKISDGTGRDFFSYSRTFPKKGGKTEQQAYNRAFQVMQEELKNSFIQEFSERLIR